MFDGILPPADPPPGLAECDLRGMKYFQPLRSLVQDFDDLPRDTRDMMEQLYDHACRNTPGASLPPDLRRLARLAADTTQAALKRRLAVITEKLDLTLCTDGRLYVGVAVPVVTAMWEKYLALSARGARGAAKRWRKTYSSAGATPRATPQAPTSETRKTQQNQQNLDANLNSNPDYADTPHTPAPSETPPRDPRVCVDEQIWEGQEAPQDHDPLQPELVLVTPTAEPEPAPACASTAEPMSPPVTTPAAPVTPPGQHLAPPPARPGATRCNDVTASPTLADLGVTKRQAHDWRKLADVPGASHQLAEPAERGRTGRPHNPRREPSRADFDALVAAWPNRQAIEAAWPIYRAALLADPELSPDTLRRAAERFAEKLHDQYHGDDNAIGRFAGHLRYWLRDKRWLDYAGADEPDERPELSEEELAMRIWAANSLNRPATRDRWNDWSGNNWGPPPGVTGCRIPPEVLAKYPDSPRYSDEFEVVYKRLKDRAWEELRKHQPLTLLSKADLVAWINSEPPPPYGILGERLAADILEGRRAVAPEIWAEIWEPPPTVIPEKREKPYRPITRRELEDGDRDFERNKAAIIAQARAIAAAASMGASP